MIRTRKRRTPRFTVNQDGGVVQFLEPTNDELDRLCGDLAKLMADYKCERCGKQYATRYGAKGRLVCDGLDWAHLITRKRLRVRWLPENTFAACAGCHFYLDGNPEEKIAFAVKRLGRKKYDLLKWKSISGPKVDRVATKAWLHQQIAELEGSGT